MTSLISFRCRAVLNTICLPALLALLSSCAPDETAAGSMGMELSGDQCTEGDCAEGIEGEQTDAMVSALSSASSVQHNIAITVGRGGLVMYDYENGGTYAGYKTISPAAASSTAKVDVKVGHGGNRRVWIVSDHGFVVDSIKLDGKSVAYTDYIPFVSTGQNHSLSVTFKKSTASKDITRVVASNPPNPGIITVQELADKVTCQVHPMQRFRLDAVYVDGKNVGRKTAIDFKKGSTHSIEAIFTQTVFQDSFETSDCGADKLLKPFCRCKEGDSNCHEPPCTHTRCFNEAWDPQFNNTAEASFSTRYAAAGERSLRFNLHYSSKEEDKTCGGRRSEVSLSSLSLDPKRIQVFSFAIRLTGDFATDAEIGKDDRADIIAQWHNYYGDHDDEFPYPPMALKVVGNGYILERCLHTPSPNKDIEKENFRKCVIDFVEAGDVTADRHQWVNWEVRVLWGKNSSARTQIKKNGKIIYDRTGANMNADRAPHLKLGIYNSWVLDTTPTQDERTIYLDNVRVSYCTPLKECFRD